MATQLIKVTKKDGKEVNYELTPAAKVAFESHFQTGWRKRLIDEFRESDLWWFAHYLMTSKGETTAALDDDFLNQYKDIDFIFDSKNG
jgi:hypothetical protein